MKPSRDLITVTNNNEPEQYALKGYQIHENLLALDDAIIKKIKLNLNI